VSTLQRQEGDESEAYVPMRTLSIKQSYGSFSKTTQDIGVREESGAVVFKHTANQGPLRLRSILKSEERVSMPKYLCSALGRTIRGRVGSCRPVACKPEAYGTASPFGWAGKPVVTGHVSCGAQRSSIVDVCQPTRRWPIRQSVSSRNSRHCSMLGLAWTPKRF
jgi:hypothetical protein